MSHIPVNHHLRPLYRTLAGFAAVYLLAFGVVGVAQTAGGGLFARTDVSALGLRTNLAFSVASVIAGGVILVAVFVGRNVDATLNLWGGIGFMAVGLAGLALLRTDLNVLNFSLATVIVSFVIGVLLFSAGLYGRSARPAPAHARTGD
jgi:Domain of unknown function (DUF4383)